MDNRAIVIDNAALKRYATITRELIPPIIEHLLTYELSRIEIQLIMSSMVCIMDKLYADMMQEQEGADA